MPTFKYKARDEFGKAIDGVMEAASSEIVAGHLQGSGHVPVFIQEKKKDIMLFDIFRKVPGRRPEDLILFSRQLSTLVGAGIPLVASLNALSKQTEDKTMKEVIDRVKSDIQGGSSLSDALAKHPRVFSTLYVSMIQAGETAGTLDEILSRLATITEHEKETRARVRVATMYPKIVIIAMSAAFIILAAFVVPRFAAMFSRFEATLPLPTRIMIGISDVIHHHWFAMFLALTLIVAGFHWYTNTKSGRWKWDNLKLRAPVFGPLFLKIAMSRFTHILGMLMRSGIDILKTLEIASTTADNRVIAREVETLRESVKEGSGLSEPLKQSRVFTPMVVQMISVGEQSGKLDEMMAKVSQYYELEVEYTIKNLSTLIEPALIVCIGGMVLFMALAIFLPMWDMARIVIQ